MDATGTVSSVLLWSFLPALLTTVLLKVFYIVRQFLVRIKEPLRSSTRYQFHWRLANFLLLSAYFITQLYEPLYGSINIGGEMKLSSYHRGLPTNAMFEQFQLTPQNFTVRALKTGFRKQSLYYHPDKYVPRAGEDAESIFLVIRATYEMLNDPVKRGMFAIFGQDAVQGCSTVATDLSNVKKNARDQYTCRSIGDFYWSAMMQQLGFYVGFVVFMVIINQASAWLYKNRKNSDNIYSATGNLLNFGLSMVNVRWILLFVLFAVEMDMIHSGMQQLSFIVSTNHQQYVEDDQAFPLIDHHQLSIFGWLFKLLSMSDTWNMRTIHEQIGVLHAWFVACLMFAMHSISALSALLQLALEHYLPGSKNSIFNGAVDSAIYMKENSNIQSELTMEVEQFAMIQSEFSRHDTLVEAKLTAKATTLNLDMRLLSENTDYAREYNSAKAKYAAKFDAQQINK